jgi:hypothetical protein
MAVIPLGAGVVDIKGVYEVVKDSPAKHSTLEIAGDNNVVQSRDFLVALGAE